MAHLTGEDWLDPSFLPDEDSTRRILDKVVDSLWSAMEATKPLATSESGQSYITYQLAVSRLTTARHATPSRLRADMLAQLVSWRIGASRTCSRLAQQHRIAERWLHECPFCDSERAEDLFHMLIECPRWAPERGESGILAIRAPAQGPRQGMEAELRATVGPAQGGYGAADVAFWQDQLNRLRLLLDGKVGDVAAALHAVWPRSWARRLELRALFPAGPACARSWTRAAALLLLGGELDGVRLAGWDIAKRPRGPLGLGDDDSVVTGSGSLASFDSERSSSRSGASVASSAGSSGGDQSPSPGDSWPSSGSLGSMPTAGTASIEEQSSAASPTPSPLLWLSSDGGGPGVHWRVGRFLLSISRERSQGVKALRLAVNEV